VAALQLQSPWRDVGGSVRDYWSACMDIARSRKEYDFPEKPGAPNTSQVLSVEVDPANGGVTFPGNAVAAGTAQPATPHSNK
jgi:hypothetical protein